MNAYVLFAITIGPGLFILSWIYYKDKYEKEPLWLLIAAFLGGAVSTVPVLASGFLWKELDMGISENLVKTALYAFVSVGFTEEFFKLLVVMLFFYRRKAFNEPFDGIVYCTAVSMGFATAENLLYVYVHQSNANDAAWVALLRMFTAVPAHATFGILMGYLVGISRFRESGSALVLAGLMVAALFHGAYDFFLFIRNIPGISVGAFLSLVLGIRLARRAILINQRVSPFRPGRYEPE